MTQRSVFGEHAPISSPQRQQRWARSEGPFGLIRKGVQDERLSRISRIDRRGVAVRRARVGVRSQRRPVVTCSDCVCRTGRRVHEWCRCKPDRKRNPGRWRPEVNRPSPCQLRSLLADARKRKRCGRHRPRLAAAALCGSLDGCKRPADSAAVRFCLSCAPARRRATAAPSERAPMPPPPLSVASRQLRRRWRGIIRVTVARTVARHAAKPEIASNLGRLGRNCAGLENR